MPWCPVCKNEYKEGYTHCKDCDVDLVDSLENGPAAVMFGEEETLVALQEQLGEHGVTGMFIRYAEKERTHELFVPREFLDEAKTLVQAHMQEIAKLRLQQEFGIDGDELFEEASEDGTDSDSEADISEGTQAGGVRVAAEDEESLVYEDKTQKAEDYKSSAFALLGVSVVGSILLVLLFLDVLPIHMYGSSKIVTCSVMGALFVVFFVMGISSLRLYKKYVLIAEDENALIEQMKELLAQNAGAQKIDAGITGLSEMDEIQKYYPRIQAVRDALITAFPEAEKALVEKIADDWYASEFEEKENSDGDEEV